MDLARTDIAITSSDFWQNEEECTEEVLAHVFRSATDEKMPMLAERMACLREAGQVLYEVSLLVARGDLVCLTAHLAEVSMQLCELHCCRQPVRGRIG